MLFFMELQRIMKKKKNLNFEKAVALIISALLFFSGCSSRSVTETSSTAVSEEISTEEKSDDEVLEDAIEMTSATSGLTETDSRAKKMVDLLAGEFDIKQVGTTAYFNNPSSEGQMIYLTENCGETCILAEKVGGDNGIFIGLDNSEWRFYDVTSIMQYSLKANEVVGGELNMHCETVTVFEYPETAEAKAVFANIIGAYEKAGVDLEGLSKEEYEFTDTSGHFIVSFGLVDQLLGADGTGETESIFREYRTFEAFYLIDNSIVRLTYTDTGDNYNLMKEVVIQLGVNDPFEVKSSQEVLEALTEHIT